MDSQEAADKLQTIQRVLSAFKASFWAAQGRSAGLWKLRPEAPFDRLDAFLTRCKDAQAMKLAILQYGKLERAEIGGTKVSAINAMNSLLHDNWYRSNILGGKH